MEKEQNIDLWVYLSLLVLTVLTVSTFYMHLGRAMAIMAAVAVASVKASLIAFYYMHLRYEKPFVYGIVLVGVLAVVILAVGILPDVGLQVDTR